MRRHECLCYLQTPPHFKIDAALEDGLGGLGRGWRAQQFGEQNPTEYEGRSDQRAWTQALANHQVGCDHGYHRLQREDDSGVAWRGVLLDFKSFTGAARI